MRSGLRLAVLLCLLGVGTLLFALGRSWVAVPEGTSVPTVSLTREVLGRQLAPGALACAYVGLAGVAALVATRGRWRVLVGVLLAAAGVGAVLALVPLLSPSTLLERALRVLAACDTCSPLDGSRARPQASVWAWVAVVGAVLLSASGILAAARGRRWPGLSSRYDRSALTATSTAIDVGPAAEPPADKAVWDAFDRGDDPTA